MKRSESDVMSLYVTPRTVPPCCRSVFCAPSSRGASSWHGAHQDAQKFRITTLPLSAASDQVPVPPRTGSARVASGAGGCSPRATCSSSVRLAACVRDAVDQQPDQARAGERDKDRYQATPHGHQE